MTYVDLPNPVPHVAKHVKVPVTFNASLDKAIMSTEQDVVYDPPE
ncbi:hypothetical protein [Amycolatopsis sp. GM8]|nr:hypothetical protein [Amycolatopsis sp. GM8]